jgi:hypothetical protein
MNQKEYQGYTLYQISNHPTISEMERWVSWAGLEIQTDANYGFYIRMKYRIWAFINDVEIPVSISAAYVNLTADNSTCVNSSGQIVECGSPDSMGEYDFYIAMMNEPVIILDFVTSKITWADSEGRFNTF